MGSRAWQHAMGGAARLDAFDRARAGATDTACGARAEMIGGQLQPGRKGTLDGAAVGGPGYRDNGRKLEHLATAAKEKAFGKIFPRILINLRYGQTCVNGTGTGTTLVGQLRAGITAFDAELEKAATGRQLGSKPTHTVKQHHDCAKFSEGRRACC